MTSQQSITHMVQLNLENTHICVFIHKRVFTTCESSWGTSSYVLESVEVPLEEVAHLGWESEEKNKHHWLPLTSSTHPRPDPVQLTGKNFVQRHECLLWFQHQRSHNAETPGLQMSPFLPEGHRATVRVPRSCLPYKGLNQHYFWIPNEFHNKTSLSHIPILSGEMEQAVVSLWRPNICLSFDFGLVSTLEKHLAHGLIIVLRVYLSSSELFKWHHLSGAVRDDNSEKNEPQSKVNKHDVWEKPSLKCCSQQVSSRLNCFYFITFNCSNNVKTRMSAFLIFFF